METQRHIKYVRFDPTSDTCAIRLDHMKTKPTATTSCHHRFCTGCIASQVLYCASNYKHVSCPMCRSTITAIVCPTITAIPSRTLVVERDRTQSKLLALEKYYRQCQPIVDRLRTENKQDEFSLILCNTMLDLEIKQLRDMGLLKHQLCQLNNQIEQTEANRVIWLDWDSDYRRIQVQKQIMELGVV